MREHSQDPEIRIWTSLGPLFSVPHEFIYSRMLEGRGGAALLWGGDRLYFKANLT